MTVLIERIGEEVDAVELFCGYGGTAQGLHAAGATVRLAANHDARSIECYGANYEHTDMMQADLSDPSNPQVVDRHGKKVPGRYMDPADLPPARLLWASPSCRFHSPANAKKLYERGPQARMFDDFDDFDEEAYANSERSRVTMLCPLRYAARHRPEIVIVENVVEAAKWGPARDGSTFRWWLAEWEKLGYEHECVFLNSQFFPPCPQSRDRMYIVLWRKGNRRPNLDYRPIASCTSDACQGAIVRAIQTWKRPTAAWPIAPWGKYRDQYVYTCPECHNVVEPVSWGAYTAINWSDLGATLGAREDAGSPLAPKTLERIRRGLMKFRGGPPLVIPAKSVWGVDRPVLVPFTTQTSQQDKALITEGTPYFVRSVGDDRTEATYPASDPLGSVVTTTKPQLAFTLANRTHATPSSIADPMRTVVGGQKSIELVTEGVVLPANGNVSERPGQTRAHPLGESLFTQHTSASFGFAHMPIVTTLRGDKNHHDATTRSPVDPLLTVTGEGFHHGIASPAMFSKINGSPGDTSWHLIDERLNTVTGRDTHGLVVLPWVHEYRSQPHAITEALATLMTHARQALASIEASTVPITDDDLRRVHFRMLEPDPELRRAMAFEDDYILLGNKTQMTSGLGNAVTPPVASWITEQCLATLRGE